MNKVVKAGNPWETHSSLRLLFTLFPSKVCVRLCVTQSESWKRRLPPLEFPSRQPAGRSPISTLIFIPNSTPARDSVLHWSLFSEDLAAPAPSYFLEFAGNELVLENFVEILGVRCMDVRLSQFCESKMWDRVCECTEIVNQVSAQQESKVKCVIWSLWIFQWWFWQPSDSTKRNNNNGGKVFENSQPDSRFSFLIEWERSEGLLRYYFRKERIGLTFTKFFLPPFVFPYIIFCSERFLFNVYLSSKENNFIPRGYVVHFHCEMNRRWGVSLSSSYCPHQQVN